MPITGSSVKDIIDAAKKKKFFSKVRWAKTVVFYIIIIAPLLLSCRLFTNSWYLSNESYFKIGIGIDNIQQPEKATEFIVNNKLKGNILNSIGYGGWLEWKAKQPVFIDGRLEVMRENLYNEVVKSWNGGLADLIVKYNPKIIVYNYQKYFAWTDQIAALTDWKLVYLDGAAAIFVVKDSVMNLPAVDFSSLPGKYDLSGLEDDKEKLQVLNLTAVSKFGSWMQGFYKKVDYQNRSLLNIASFCLELKQYTTAERFFLEVLKRSEGQETSVYYALSEIYKNIGDREKEELCLQKIISFDKKNKIAISSMQELKSGVVDTAKTIKADSKENKARLFFNSGNTKYRAGDIQGALTAYDSAIARKPDYYKAYNNLAIIKANELKKDKEALKDFDKAIELNADYSDAYLGRGTSKYNLKDYDGACTDWRKAAALGNVQASKQIEKYCK